MEFPQYSIWKVHEMNYLGDIQLIYVPEYLVDGRYGNPQACGAEAVTGLPH